jgi:hypothetical protein
VSTQDPFEGPFSAKVPFNILTGEVAQLEIPINVEQGEIIHVQFAIKNDHTHGDLIVTFNLNETQIVIPKTTWKVYTTSYVATVGNDELGFTVEAINDSELSPIFLDDIQITYETGHVLKIEDGNQAHGYLLQSDELGHATWVDFESVVDDNIEDAYQDLGYDETLGQLSISNGNEVVIFKIKGSSGDWKVDKIILLVDHGQHHLEDITLPLMRTPWFGALPILLLILTLQLGG